MAQPILNVTFKSKGLSDLRDTFRSMLLTNSGSKEKLHDRIGIAILAWIDKNFKAQGLEKPWAPLRPSTLFGKRQSGKGAKALDGLRSWATHKATTQQVVVGFPSNSPAKYHHYGTPGPYEIRPKNKKALRFLMPPFSMATGKARTVLSPRPAGMPKVGMVKGNKQSWLFTQVVHHPGLPARPLLPSIAMAQEIARKVIEDALTEMIGKGGRK